MGNAAGDGARIALLNCSKRVEAQDLVEWVTYVETAVDPDFQDEFADAIHIPHASDSFSHIAELLPQQSAILRTVQDDARGRRYLTGSRMKKISKQNAAPDKNNTVFIVCGALAREVIAIRDKHGWQADVLGVPALLHNWPERIPPAVQKRITALREQYGG